jgi:hypothetical protein
MNDVDASDERAGEATAKLTDGIKNCRSVVKNYRLMFAEHPATAPEPVPERPEAEDLA